MLLHVEVKVNREKGVKANDTLFTFNRNSSGISCKPFVEKG